MGGGGDKGSVGPYHKASGLDANLHLLALCVLSPTSLETSNETVADRLSNTSGGQNGQWSTLLGVSLPTETKL